jgi:hypothetical protein
MAAGIKMDKQSLKLSNICPKDKLDFDVQYNIKGRINPKQTESTQETLEDFETKSRCSESGICGILSLEE